MIQTYESQLRCGIEETSNSLFFRNLTDYSILHTHDYFEFLVILSGQYKHLFNGELLLINPGDCFLIRPQDEHSLTAVGPCGAHINIALRPEKLKHLISAYSPDLFESLSAQKIIHFVMNPQQLNSIYALASEINDKKGQEDHCLCANLALHRLTNYLVEQNALVGGKKPSWLKNLLLEIAKPENLHWRSEDIKEHSNFSKTHLNRCFKQYLGMSVGDYLIEVKMSAAENYLLHSDIPVGEIASILGYSSVSHFNHLFKKQFGKSPLAYKKHNA